MEGKIKTTPPLGASSGATFANTELHPSSQVHSNAGGADARAAAAHRQHPLVGRRAVEPEVGGRLLELRRAVDLDRVPLADDELRAVVGAHL